MEFILVVVAVLSLLSVGQSAPVASCEILTQTLKVSGRDQLLGKWMHIAESTNMPGSKVLTKMFVENAWSNITAANDNNTVNSIQYQKMFGKCFSLQSSMTLENNTFTMVKPFAVSAVLLNTGCPDCIIFFSTYIIGNSTYRGLQFLSRRSKVNAAQLEEFNKQRECLNLPPAAVLNSEKGFCLDGSIDLTSDFGKISSEGLILMDEIFRSESAGTDLMDLISSHAGQLGPK